MLRKISIIRSNIKKTNIHGLRLLQIKGYFFSISILKKYTHRFHQILLFSILSILIPGCGKEAPTAAPIPIPTPGDLVFYADADEYQAGEGEIGLVVENHTGKNVFLPMCGPWTLFRVMSVNKVVVWKMDCPEDYLAFELPSGQAVAGTISLGNTASSPYYLDAIGGNYRAEVTVYEDCQVGEMEWEEAGPKYGELDDCASSRSLSSQVFTIEDAAGQTTLGQTLPLSPIPTIQVATGLRLTGQIGGTVDVIAVQEGLIAAGIGSRLELLDAATLLPIGRLVMLPSLINDLVLDGNRAFLSLGEGGLMIVDITDPSNPIITGVFQPGGSVNGVAINGNLAWITAGADGIWVLDVTNPTDPIIVNKIKTGQLAIDVDLSNGRAFLLNNSKLVILDSGNPTSPQVLAEMDLEVQGRRIQVSDDRAFIAARENGVITIDLSDINMPVELGTIATNKAAMGLAVSGKICMVADYTAGLAVIDTDALTITGQLDTSGVAMNVVALDGRAWVADYSGGIRQIDMTDPENPIEIQPSFATVGWVNGVSVDNDKIALAGTAGLALLNKQDFDDLPDVKFEVAEGNWIDRASVDVLLHGDRAYLIDDQVGLRIYDVAQTPIELGSFQVEKPRSIDIAGEVLYLAHSNGLLVLDISVLPPVKIQSLTREWNPGGIIAAGDALYVADVDKGVWTLEIPNPARIVQTGYWDRPARGLAMGQNILVSAAGSKGLRTAAIGDPLRPIELGRWVTEDARSVVVVDQVAYLADMVSGIHVIGLQDPTSPIQIGILDTPGSSQDITSDGENVYVADSAGGLLIYRRE